MAVFGKCPGGVATPLQGSVWAEFRYIFAYKKEPDNAALSQRPR
jgi:hypothetical protein